MKLLTVSIPTYNRCDKLAKTLANLIGQIERGGFENDIEIVVSDNASSDNTKNIVCNLQNEHPNIDINYYRNRKNLGWENLKLAADYGQGKFVWICSDDDALDSRILSVIVKNISDNENISYLYIPSVQSNIALSGKTQIKNLLKNSVMCGALVSSNVFRRDAVSCICVKSFTWYHLNLLFNMDMSASCVVLPKLIDIKMPDKQDKSYWEYNALKALDYNTEIVWVAHISAAPNEIKKLVYSHYKRVIFKNIKRAFLCINKSLAKKCANRLKGIKGFGVEYIVLSILSKFAKK